MTERHWVQTERNEMRSKRWQILSFMLINKSRGRSDHDDDMKEEEDIEEVESFNVEKEYLTSPFLS